MDQPRKAFTFDDISLVPGYSEMERGDIDIEPKKITYYLSLPIISSPMDTITGMKMILAMEKGGGIGIHHRYCTLNTLEGAVSHVGGVAVSPSIGVDKLETTIFKIKHNPLLCLDVAHGHTKRNLDFAYELVKMGANVISGNIVTKEAAEAYLKIGVKTLRVGIGAGSVCTTRMVTGVGVPQLSAIQGIYKEFPDATIISDGGHRTTGDIVKALALGADFVMLGGMLAGTDESEAYVNGWTKEDGDGNTLIAYRGMASKEALSLRKSEFFVEGAAKYVKPKGSVANILGNIKDAIETACYYLGARNLQELKEADYVYVTQNGYREGLAL